MSNKTLRIIVITLWTIFLVGTISLFSLFSMVKNDYNGWFGGLPSLQDLEKPDPDLSSELISSDGVSLGKYYRQNRTPVSYQELSTELVNTLIVTEDERFKQHSGVDLRALVRAAFGVLTFNFNGGGSTITMQLAENLYRTNDQNHGTLYKYSSAGRLITKLKEYIIAVQLEQSYTKEEILAMYLNTVPFGSNSFGINVAAKTFFNKLPSQLTYKEAAVLIGSINAPTRYNPVYNPENALAKRTEVLYNLHKYGLIDRVSFDTLKVSDFGLNYKVDNHNEGLATYFRSVIGRDLLQWSKDHGYDLYDDGLKIYTTIDSRMQQYAEEAMSEAMDTLQQVFFNHLEGDAPWIDKEGNEIVGFLHDAVKRTSQYRALKRKFDDETDSIEFHLNQKKQMTVFSWDGEIDTVFSVYDSLAYYKHFLQAGFMAMDPKNGHIKAWVGGIDHKYFKFDHVQYGKRQPGSTFKPFIYTVAIDNGWSPCYPVVDAPVTIAIPGGEPWQPENANGKFSGSIMTIRQAMARSVNSITAYVMDKVGPQTVVDYAHRMGIESDLAVVPSLALGVSDVSLYEMLGAYSTFVNKGVYTQPFFISRIEDQNGNVIQQFVPETREALNEQTAYVMLHMLKGTTEEPGGTGTVIDRELRVNNEIAAKTGTTQNASDGWFMGITKDLAAGAWVGGDDRSIHFKYWPMGQGARTAMPIWERFMTKVYADPTLGIEKGSFPKPVKPITVELDCNQYQDVTLPSDSIRSELPSEDDF
ncbi:MAG: transglycosylase [Flammeovirgaceae bacterium]|nr:transglycosylase [Flammeovirgaceae bacterium]MBE63911.1 transglycosylase [Flammeovirgaceae bacterium]|tara:strand:+ start:1529 stop:3790 length:2262 start_codon:yes stop_codon:yes gene_type:complete